MMEKDGIFVLVNSLDTCGYAIRAHAHIQYADIRIYTGGKPDFGVKLPVCENASWCLHFVRLLHVLHEVSLMLSVTLVNCTCMLEYM
jgi:hypothetical protein